jgi:membrane peptidoglycan carboxypeptidase
MSIGYEIGVTPLQMATAFATIANDGVKNQPHIIKEIRDSEGNTISINEPNQSQVVSAKTARSLQAMLRQVVLSGTGRRAQLDGYTSAGKTGTAWKFDPKTKRIDRGKYMSTFIGFAPVEDPKFLIAVVMDEPKTGARDGGTVSAPVFKDIAQQILTNAGVPHDLAPGTSTSVAQEIPEVANTAEVKGPPAEKDDAASEKVAATKAAKKPDKSSTPEPKDQPVDNVPADVNKIAKPAPTTPDLWKTKPKT